MRVIVCLVTIVCVSAAFSASEAAAKVGSNCGNIRTFAQADRAGVMPAIVAALHGGAPPAGASLLACGTQKH
jgi:hypothetical protein